MGSLAFRCSRRKIHFCALVPLTVLDQPEEVDIQRSQVTWPRVHSLETGSQDLALAWLPASLFSVLSRFLDNTKAKRAARHPATQGQQADANSHGYFPQRLSSSQRLMETPAVSEEGGPGPGWKQCSSQARAVFWVLQSEGHKLLPGQQTLGEGDKRLQMWVPSPQMWRQ